ncbi:Uncharacterised protein [BD1-7 clade bacterium]|uniref:Cytochrome c domain-containing protein n=1 Tax=BD1-7 clade bacterium TaxID=2029982 RepID=A0A5S9PSQ1_9GAMM|nr:Uncharacterised protein [BD1-7 clade bacterium]
MPDSLATIKKKMIMLLKPTPTSAAMIIATSVLLSACGDDSDGKSNPPSEPRIEHLSGGEATVTTAGARAFQRQSRNMDDVNRIVSFNEGNHFFENPWVQGTASTQARDGLGPYFNRNACQSCHVNDGRGHAADVAVDGVERGTDFNSLLIRVSRAVAPENERQANTPDSNVGGQLQHKAVLDVQKEASLAVSYTATTISFADGHTVALRKPTWHMESHIGDFDSDAVFSARVAPPMIGLGLLELIKESDILANEDVSDTNNDGISGEANRVWSLDDDDFTLGRFGWKAGQPSLLEQSAGAFAGDMGLTSRFHPNENCHNHQADCLAAPNGNGDDNYEVTDSNLSLIDFYSHHLAVPARRDAYDRDVQRGKQLFVDAGCTACHTPSYTTGSDALHPELSNQTIFPYTDMLLHDMGAELADFTVDNQPVGADVQVEYLASATEWRTPPLWGIGFTKEVDEDATFLHDGRARTILEAVLWHDGEAKSSRDKVLMFDAQQRADFEAFLNDL